MGGELEPGLCPNCGDRVPEGLDCGRCSPGRQPDLEAILRASQGIPGDLDGAIRAMASVHAQWKAAWTETGFSEQEAFELVRVLVACSSGGGRCLNLLWGTGRHASAAPWRAGTSRWPA